MNQERPKVTVYVPCHHYGRFLGQAVQSVIDQLFQAWELIIVDDGSTDETARVALEYVKNHPDRIRVIRLPVARGLPAAANAALADARGDYVMRLDADDFLDIGDKNFYFGKGCDACNQTGYKGRKGIYELMRISDPIRELINERAPTVTLKQKAVELGMVALRHDGLRSIFSGDTTIEEVLKYT